MNYIKVMETTRQPISEVTSFPVMLWVNSKIDVSTNPAYKKEKKAW